MMDGKFCGYFSCQLHTFCLLPTILLLPIHIILILLMVSWYLRGTFKQTDKVYCFIFWNHKCRKLVMFCCRLIFHLNNTIYVLLMKHLELIHNLHVRFHGFPLSALSCWCGLQQFGLIGFMRFFHWACQPRLRRIVFYGLGPLWQIWDGKKFQFQQKIVCGI